ncbi:8709_t:CDS:2, partial [Gigaspora margarita]
VKFVNKKPKILEGKVVNKKPEILEGKVVNKKPEVLEGKVVNKKPEVLEEMNEQIIEIPRHNGKEITKIVYSPKLKYVATWSDEDMSACIYSIKDQMYLKFEDYYPLKEQVEHGLSGNIKKEFLNAKKYEIKLSDQKHIALMPYNEGHRYAGNRKLKILKHHDNKKEIIESNFIVKDNKDNEDNYFLLVRGEKNDGDIKSVADYLIKLYGEKNDRDIKNLTGYMFESSGKLKKTFRISNYDFDDNIVLHNNGTIFIYKRDTHIILARNIVTMTFITYLPTEWDIDCTRNIIVNKEATLLQNYFSLLDPYIFNGEYNEERSEYPYIFINKEPEKISEHPSIFKDEGTEETFNLKLNQPCIINYNMIFYIYENELKLRKFPEAWKNKLNNMRSNFVAEEVLEEIEKNDESTKSITHQYYDKWNIRENGQNNILLSYNNEINIPYTGIKRISLLKNNDLLMNVIRNEHENSPSKNIFIWTIKENFKEMQKIRLDYFWSNLDSFKEECKVYLPYLPPPEFEFELKGEKMQKIRDFNKLMIEDYINSRSKLSFHGEYLMEHLLKKNDFESIEKLLKNIINFTMKNNDGNFISNIPLMNIITYNFRTLSQYPDIINWFLSRIVFFVPDNTLSEIINLNSTSYHLQKFGEYPNISDIYLIHLKIESFLKSAFRLHILFLKLVRKKIVEIREGSEVNQKKTTVKLGFPLMAFSYYQSRSDMLREIELNSGYFTYLFSKLITSYLPFIPYINPFGFSVDTNLYELWSDELRKVVRQIQNNTWPGLYKPCISPVLLEAIQMKSEPDEDD